jgi:hypothetical protein
MTGVGPTDDVRRCAILAVHLQDLAVAVRFADVERVDGDPVTYLCTHVTLPGS